MSIDAKEQSHKKVIEKLAKMGDKTAINHLENQDKVSEEEEAKKLLEFFKKKETQEKVLALAIQIREVFGRSWFTVLDCVKVFKEASPQQIIDILNSLNLSGFLIIKKKGDHEKLRISGNQFKKIESALKK